MLGGLGGGREVEARLELLPSLSKTHAEDEDVDVLRKPEIEEWQ